MINWKQKLSSRKFWAAVVGFVTTLLVAFTVPDLTIERVAMFVSAVGTLVAYIFAEGNADAKHAGQAVEGVLLEGLAEVKKSVDDE